MNTLLTPLNDLWVFSPRVFSDERGYFFESFNQKQFDNLFSHTTGGFTFVQDNESRSQRGVLRGLHYQIAPKAQGKLVRVIQGEVWDVAVDLRCSSTTFGQWHGELLSAENKRQMWIPPGFAHGFITLSENAIFQYKVTDYWSQNHERCIAWNDPQLNIDWQFKGIPTLSDKDASGQNWKATEYF
jgi:dTDP-4-dehydrorhamnose 3,5-epimerase